MRGYKRTGGSMADPRERLKVLSNSMPPIVVIESVEEVRAVDLVCSACADLSLPVFQWNIADGLSRCGNNPSVHEQAVVIGNTREPQQALAHLETMNIEAVVLLENFHRPLEDPVVGGRLRDWAPEFCPHRRRLVITAPAVTFPPEFSSPG